MSDLEKQHARISPSGMKRWMTCPRSVSFVEELGIKDKASKYAAEGTVAHTIHELSLLKNCDAISYLGDELEADGFKFKVNENMVDAVQESIDYIRCRIQEAEDFGLRVEMLVEVNASLKYIDIDGLDGGTADVVLLFWDGDRLIEVEVIDYKHGQGVAVEVFENPQGLSYALGVVMRPEFKNQDIPGDIRITISQPRAHHPDGRIRHWTLSKDYLFDWEETVLVPAAIAVHCKDAKFGPSDEGCRFCPAAGNCPALYDKTQEVAMVDFASDEEVNFPTVRSLTAEQKRKIMDHAGALRSFIVAVENQIKLEVDSGSKEYEGHYKLVRMKTNRRFLDDALDVDFSPLLDYLSEDDMYVKKPCAMGEIEKRLKAKLKEQGVKGFVNETSKIMKTITEKPEGDLVIALESDKRIGVQPSIVGDFSNLDD